MTRIPFADPNVLTAEGKDLYERRPTAIIRVLANASDSLLPWVKAAFGIHQSPDLSPVLRELLALRMVSSIGSAYQVAGHTPAALAAGATPEQVDAACSGASLEGTEGIIVSLVDDLFAGRGPSDERFARALELVSARALVEAILIGGISVTIGRLGEAAALALEPELTGPLEME